MNFYHTRGIEYEVAKFLPNLSFCLLISFSLSVATEATTAAAGAATAAAVVGGYRTAASVPSSFRCRFDNE